VAVRGPAPRSCELRGMQNAWPAPAVPSEPLMPLWWRVLRNTLLTIGVTVVALCMLVVTLIGVIDMFDTGCTAESMSESPHCRGQCCME
jgi:hypothetical protein